MQVSEHNVERNESDILWISGIVAPQFDSLAEHKCPYQQASEDCLKVMAFFESLICGGQYDCIPDWRPGGDGGLQNGVGTPWLRPIPC